MHWVNNEPELFEMFFKFYGHVISTGSIMVTDVRDILRILSKIYNGWKPLTLFAKRSILDDSQDSEYVSGC